MKTVRRTLILFLLLMLLCSLMAVTSAGAATRAEIDAATTKGIEYLVPLQSTGGAPTGAWPGDSYYPANTGFAVAVLEHYAEKLGKAPLDPTYAYAANVQAGLDYLFSSATYDAVNGWVYWNVGGNNSYQTGPCVMAIARSGAPTATVTGGALNGLTYLEVAQMAVDWLGSAQIMSGNGTGAWYYNKGGTTGDQSATGWVTMGLGYAVHSMGCTLPAGLLTRLSTWNDFIQCDTPGPDFGGAAYTSSYLGWYNIYKNGHLLFAQALCGDTLATQRVQDGLTFMALHWPDPTNGSGSVADYGWRGDPPTILPSYIATAAAMKGFTEMGIETFSGIDWYSDLTDVIVANQFPDGHWLGGGHGENVHRSTCWALLTLLKATSHVPPQVVTNAATAVTGSSATLNADLTNMGSSAQVTVSFEYGTAPGTYAAETTPVAKTAPGTVAADLSGLTEGTTYYYRAKAAGDVTAYGGELSFTTSVTPTPVTPVITDPPTTVVKGCPSDWVRHTVALRFVATPAPGGAPVAYTEYSVAGRKWTHGKSVKIKRQGVTTVRYRSADTLGNVEATKSCKVRVDSVAPVVIDYGHPVAWRGGLLRCAYKVKDASSRRVTARLAITRYHYPIKQYGLGTQPVGRRLVTGVNCNLGVGTWCWRVVVRDQAGNRGLGKWHYVEVYPNYHR